MSSLRILFLLLLFVISSSLLSQDEDSSLGGASSDENGQYEESSSRDEGLANDGEATADERPTFRSATDTSPSTSSPAKGDGGEEMGTDGQDFMKDEGGADASDEMPEERRADKAQNVEATPTPVISEEEASHQEEKKELDVINSTLDQRPSDLLREVLKPFQTLTEEEIRNLLKVKIGSNEPYGPILVRAPFVLTFATKMIKDKEALPGLARTVENRENLVLFIGMNLIGFVLRFMIRKHNKKLEGTPGKMKRVVLEKLIIYTYFVGLMIFFFYEDLMPTVRVLLDTIF